MNLSIHTPIHFPAWRHLNRSMVALVISIVWLLLFCSAPSLGQDEDPRGFMASKGRVTYRLYCASCHGPDGAGDGPIAAHLKVSPTDLTRISERYGGEFPREWIRQIIDGRTEVGPHGSREMPVWGDVFQAPMMSADGERMDVGESRAERKIEELVVFLESIQPQVPAAKPVEP